MSGHPKHRHDSFHRGNVPESQLGTGTATDGHILTATAAGTAAWENPATNHGHKQVSFPDSVSAAADYLARIKLAADTEYRVRLGLDASDRGEIAFGGGSAAADVILRRGGASIWELQGRLDLLGGQVKFPAAQNASADANTLDDYEEGSWTPVLSFATPGDLAVVYSIQVGRYVRIGSVVWVMCRIAATTFTYTTAAGEIRIQTLPFTAANTQIMAISGAMLAGWTKAGYSTVTAVRHNTAVMTIFGQASGVVGAPLTTADIPSGAFKEVIVAGTYQAA